jgi:PTS system cellobiose-specific IIB component
MFNVKIFCHHGASTKLLVNKCIAEAAKRGIELQMDAHPDSALAEHIEGCDLVVLAPQVRFKMKSYQKEYPKYKFMSIDPSDYGMMNTENIVDEMLKHLQE